jgi:hypothetical protein
MWTDSQKDDGLVAQSFTVAVLTFGFLAALFADDKDDAEVLPNVRAAAAFEMNPRL